MTKRFGFTLAEVLITLGIIGVVAAMTMPTLINQTNGAQYKAAYKKALSAISQGVTLNVALEDISFADATVGSAEANVTGDNKDKTIAGFLSNRMNVVSTSYGQQDYQIDAANFGENNVTLYFNDSSMFSFPQAAVNCTASDRTATGACLGIIDVNGKKGPNKKVTNADSPTDVYPVIFYDQTILPATEVGKQVLYGK